MDIEDAVARYRRLIAAPEGLGREDLPRGVGGTLRIGRAGARGLGLYWTVEADAFDDRPAKPGLGVGSLAEDLADV